MKIHKALILIGSLLFFFQNCSEDESSSPEPTPQITNNVGASANAYLSDQQYKSLKVEIVFESASAPETSTLDSLKAFLERRLKKPNGISFVNTVIPDQNKTALTLADIRAVETDYRTVFNSSDEISAFFYFSNGSYIEDTDSTSTLGLAFNSSSMCVFERTIVENTGGLGEARKEDVEEGVLKHEFCHILGLVNLGSPPQVAHEDQDHPKHCDVKSCLMYFAINTRSFIGLMRSNSVPKLDSQCLADLNSNGGK
jgi:hypothetical protein